MNKMIKLKAIILVGTMSTVSVLSLTGCSGPQKPRDGVWSPSWFTALCAPGGEDGYIEINGSEGYFSTVWMGTNAGAQTGDVDINDWEVYDNGAWYWKGEITCHGEYRGEECEYTQDAFSNSKGTQISLAGYTWNW